MSKYNRRKDGRLEATKMIHGHIYHVYGRSDHEVSVKLEQLTIDSENSDLYIDKTTLLKNWTSHWLELIHPDISDNTFNMYKNNVRIINNSIGDIPLCDVLPSQAQMCLNSCAGKCTRKKVRMTGNRLYKAAIADGLIRKNPFELTEKVNYKPSEKRPLSDAEKQAVINIKNFSGSDLVYLHILYYCGLRRCEALALSRHDINLKKRKLTVNSSIVFLSGSESYMKDTKSYAGKRSITIPRPLAAELKEYLSTVDIYLFPNMSGGIMTKNAFMSKWNRIICEINAELSGKNGIASHKKLRVIDVTNGITPHTFRHNYCTALYYAGIDLKEAQYLMGHADAATTLRIYTHLAEAEKREKNSTKIDEYFDENNAQKSV